MKFLSTIVVLLAALLIIAMPLSAQDTGIKDTLRFVPSSGTWTIDTDADTLFTLALWGWSDQNIKATSLPFVMATSTGGGTGHDDSLIVLKDWVLSIAPNIPVFSFSHIDGTSFPAALHNNYNGALIGMVNLFTPLFPPNTLTKLGDLTVTMLDPENASCEFDIVIDSMFFPPAGTFKYSPDVGSGYPPQFVGTTIHVVNNLCQVPTNPTIGVDPASFDFEAVEGGSNPLMQVLNVSNIGDGTLNWSVPNAESWLSLNPTSGVDTDSTMLSVDITGLSAATYEDTVTVSDPSATNNPVKVPVMLTVLEPPPVIVLDPTSFSFEGVLGETVVDVDSLFITNGGGRTLNWTTSDDVDWLTLAPTSGSGDGIVEFVVDISSLDSAGTYLATVTVSDPEATNNPQTAAVTLNVAEVSSDLAAVFDPDPAYIYYKFAIDSIMATVFIGNFSEHVPEDVVGTSILVNGTVEARSTIITTHPDFVDPVLAVTIAIGTFLDTYGPVLDTAASEFTVEGIYDDSIPFSTIGTLDIIGHYSRNPKQYIVPDNFTALPGDIDQSGGIDIDDIIMTVGYVFLGRPLPGSIVKADYDCSHSVDIDDIIHLAEYVFLGGGLPCVS